MKKSKICLFAYRPEHYRQMEGYLNKMMAAGWKLKWCRGIFAGFEPADRDLRYGVDPEAMTSLAYFRRLPKRKLNARTAEGWHAISRSKGCQIFATIKPDAPLLTPEQDLGPLVKSTCRLASMIWVLLLAVAGLFLFKEKAVVYTLILTNLYLVLGLLGVGLDLGLFSGQRTHLFLQGVQVGLGLVQFVFDFRQAGFDCLNAFHSGYPPFP